MPAPTRSCPHRPLAAVVLTVLLALLLAAPARLWAATDDVQAWGAAIANPDPANGPWQYWFEAQARFSDDAGRLGQGIVRAGLGRTVAERTVLWAGYAVIPNRPPGRGNDTTEHRLWQQLTWRTAEPVAGWTVGTRTRLEQRWLDDADGTAWRARQLVKLTRNVDDRGRHYLAVWDEWFLNLDDAAWGPRRGFDQNRVFVGIGSRLAPGVVTEVGYLGQHVERRGRPDARNHVLSLTVFLTR